MSQATQIEFARLVDRYYQRNRNALRLSRPSIIHDGFVSKATMPGAGGFVEILYGPPEYHAEIFITSQKEQKRWGLADLMSVATAREWLVDYSKRTDSQGTSELEAEIYWIFLILIDGLRGVATFEWLHSPRDSQGL